MRVNNNNQNGQRSEEQKPSNATPVELREISEEELKIILEDHKKWIESSRRKGVVASLNWKNLSAANLSGTDLRGKKIWRANLSGANLSGANLSKAELSDADFSEANLTGANLSGANLKRSNLNAANLRGTNFSEAVLSSANLSGTNLSKGTFSWKGYSWTDNREVGGSDANFSEAVLNGADLSSANLSGQNLNGLNLSGANLSKANLSDANLNRANLSRANFSNANLSGANLNSADLSEANLIEANLSRTDLSEADLNGAFLREANLRGANIYKANLSEADLRMVNLRWANLNRADLSKANLSGAIVNEHTETKKISGCQIGVNGIFSKETDSAALMTITPPGDSMQGPSPDAVIESLKRARRIHGLSLTSVGIVLLIAVLDLPEISFPYAKDVIISPAQFCLLGMPMSIALLSIVNTFMSDALRGAQYLNDRKSAMTVSNFPWTLSKFTGRRRGDYLAEKIKSFFIITQSYITRILMSFHGVIYISYAKKWAIFDPLVFWFLSVLIVIFCSWTFLISQKFQKPILFDRRTEEERKDNIEKLTEVVKEQTSVMRDLFDILRPNDIENTKITDSGDRSSDSTENL